MASEVSLSLLDVNEYLQGEQRSQVRHEYVAGRIFDMVGSSRWHNLITNNIYTAFRARLKGGPCRAFTFDMKVRVEEADVFYYPDIVVTCNPDDSEKFFLTRPCLVVEVLPPGTETSDRREKLLAYQRQKSLQEYVLVSQDPARVEVYRRDERGGWSLATYSGDDEIRLESIDLTLPLAAVYEDALS